MAPNRLSILIALIGMCSLHLAHAQSQDSSGIRKHSIYLEFGGNGGMISINYDRIIRIDPQVCLVPRIGFSEYSNSEEPSRYILVTGVSMLLNGPKHFIECGVGWTFYFDSDLEQLWPVSFGYRYQGQKGFLFRFTPMYMISNTSDSFGNSLWLGVSVGFSF